jgi:PAS domain S-box-containing protein
VLLQRDPLASAPPPPTPSAAVDDALSGGGEMGALIRATDWSQTPLGSSRDWPQSLRTALSIMLESRFAMVVAWGPEFRFFYNNGYRPILGGKHPAALGRPGHEIFPEVWDVVGPEFERVRRGESFAIEDWLLPLDRNGYLENCWFTLSYSPIRDESGGVGGLLAVVAETTDRVQGERRLATLRELARYSSEAANAEDVCHRATKILGDNPLDVPFSLIYARSSSGDSAQLVASSGLASDSPAALPKIDLRELNSQESGWPLARAINDREAVVVTDLARRFGNLPGGPVDEPAHTALVLPLVRSGDTEPYGAVILGVSPRRALDDRYRGFLELVAEQIVGGVANARAYEAERRRAEALAELDRAKTMFFSNVSHEFRTPLTLMLGPLEDLLSGARGDLGAAARDEVAAAHRNALRLLRLVNSLLDFSRLEAGRARALYQPVDLAALTSDLASVFRAAVERAGLRFEVRCPALGEPVYVDRGMWEKIVFNLLSNALKFTFDGAIGLELRVAGEFVELEVRDTGIGIPVEEQANVFKRFHRVQDARARTHEGTGIGLALVHDLAMLHGGDVRLTSAPNHGSSFVVRVRRGTAHLAAVQLDAAPAAEPTSIRAEAFVEEALLWLPEPAANESRGARIEARGERPAAHILVVDDNADMRSYVHRLLESRYEVETASNGEEALAAIAQRQPDLVLTDVMMPRLDGFGLVRALRSSDATRGIPVIMLSARAGEESAVEGLSQGVDDYIVKPFAARELLARVQTHIELARARTLAIRERARVAEQERRRFASIFESAPAVICILRGPDHVFEAANAAYRELVGHRELVGKTVREAFPDVAGQGYFELLDQVYTTGKPYVGTEARLVLQRGSDGQLEEVFVNFVYQPLIEPDGSISGVFCHGYDVTPQVRARREVQALYERVHDANDTKMKFLASMSHELRTPLNAIIGYADLLTLGVRGRLAAEQLSDIERIVTAARYLLGLINDILNFTRVEAGHLDLDLKAVAVDSLLDRTRELVSQPLSQNALQFEYEPPPPGLAIEADAERTQQILLNLLTNAIKFTAPGGRVLLSCDADETTVRIRVGDTGCGIPEAQLERVFEPFVQINAPSAGGVRHGVGLGLAISRDLARRMGGDITLTSRVGVGSEFVVLLRRSATT